MNTLPLIYQNEYVESRVNKIVLDDHRFGEKQELVTPEDKLGYALLILTLFAIQ